MYYAIFDRQTKCYMHTAYNATSIDQVIEDYISYKSIDTDIKTLSDIIRLQGIQNTLEDDEFILESSETEFPNID